MDMIDIAREQIRAFEAGKAFATVTIVDARGTTSRTYSKMLVFADGTSLGTVGGSAKERQAVEDALECIRSGGTALRRYRDDSDGEFTMFIEPSPRRPLLVVVGGGHVGGAVLRLARFLGYETWLIDDRSDEVIGEKIALSSRFTRIRDYREDIRALDIPSGAFAVLCSYCHATDRDALAAMLDKELAYLGMLGSQKKKAGIFAALEKEGVPESRLAAVRTPIGLDLGGETPEAVALSILSEIQSVRHGTDAASLAR